MTPVAVFSPQSRSPLIHAESPMEQTARKTNAFVRSLGGGIRDLFFLPLSRTLSPAVEEEIRGEEKFVKNFWDSNAPLDLNYPHQQKIRDAFTVSDQPIRMEVNGQAIEATCRIIETKESGHKFNFVHVLGNLSTLANNATSTYPFLAAYLDSKEKDPTLPPARFILISHYDVKTEQGPFKPETLEEAGLVVKKTLEALSQAHGPADLLVAQSLGAIIFAASLKHIKEASVPRSLAFDRAPSSIEASSKNYFLGSVLHAVAKRTGWSVDIGQELTDFYRKGATTPCTAIAVKKDFYFSGPASLTAHPALKDLPYVETFEFDLPNQLVASRAHHNIRADFLNGNYLLNKNRDALRGDHLAGALLRRSFERLSPSHSRIAV